VREVPSPSLLVVLLDALDQSLARDLAGRGRMPVLAALLERSSWAFTDAPEGFFVGGVWPAFSCSANAGRHGQYHWRQFDPATYVEADPPYDDGDAEPFWQALDRAGQRVLALDVPRSVCVPLEHGVALHDYTSHDPLAPGFTTSPPSLAPELARRFERPTYRGCDLWPRRTPDDVLAFEARLASRIGVKERTLEALARERGPFDVVLVGYADAHCAGHHLWHVHDRAHPQHDPALAARVGDPLERVYERLDAALGRTLALAGATTRTFVLLSHGMGPHHDGAHLLDRLLERLDRRLPGTRALTWRERLMTLRARGRRPKRCGLRRLWRRWPSLRVRPAFAVGNNEAWAGVRLNVVGREAAGLIDPSQREAALLELARLLESARNPGTGRAAFTRVRLTRDICRGERAHLLPDVVAEWSRAGPFHALEIPGLGRVEGAPPAQRTGDHLPTGLALAAGPGIAPGPLPRRLTILELAPTLCAWQGVRMPRADGGPVAEWLAAPVVTAGEDR
jgi:predicted AlkP superfamily phosphohydrolase/phosphomutase